MRYCGASVEKLSPGCLAVWSQDEAHKKRKNRAITRKGMVKREREFPRKEKVRTALGDINYCIFNEEAFEARGEIGRACQV